jgi:hypothetical protein
VIERGVRRKLEKKITQTPKAVVDESYRLISFKRGAEPVWERFRQLFAPGAILALRVFPEDKAISLMGLEDYVIKQIREGMKEEGYSEKIVSRREFTFGHISEVRVVFEMQFGEGRPHTALDIYQLVRNQGRWWIVAIISEILEPGAPVPEGFLGS